MTFGKNKNAENCCHTYLYWEGEWINIRLLYYTYQCIALPTIRNIYKHTMHSTQIFNMEIQMGEN
jgi:hypothetical protein